MYDRRDRKPEPQVEYKQSRDRDQQHRGDHRPARERDAQRPQAEPKSPLNQLMGQKIIIQSRTGVLYSGTLSTNAAGFVRLDDCSIKAKDYSVRSKWALVDRNVIGHVYPGDAEVTENPQE